MRIIWVGIILLGLAVTVQAENKLYLSETNGLPERYEVRSFDGESVRLSCSAGETNYPISSFSPADQKTIKNWASDKAFMSSSELRIHVKKIGNKKEFSNRLGASQTGTVGGKNQGVSYRITLQNRSKSQMKGVSAECRIFYKKGHYPESVR